MPRDPRLFVTVSLDLPSNPKLADASPAAKWLNVCGYIVARREKSDGIVRPPVVVAEADVPSSAVRQLVERGVWHHPGHECDRCAQPPKGFVTIHDYLEHQQSKADIEESHRKKSEAGRKGADSRWHGTRHSTSHATANGKPMAEQWQSKSKSKKTVVQSVSEPPSLRVVENDGLDEEQLDRIRLSIGSGCTKAHALKTARFVLAKAPTDVRNPVSYVLAAIADDPDAYRYRRGNPTKQTECREHAGEWADACRACAIDKRLGGSA
jgi:hypothetical protein